MDPVTIDSYGHGGVGVCRIDGKVHFIEGALPGDRVEFEVLREKRAWARARTTNVLEPGPHRRPAPCPHAAACGGCDLQAAVEPSQRAWKQAVVAEQLARLGGVEVDVEPTVAASPDFRYRNRMDFSVSEGKPALHRRSSNELVRLDLCLLLVEPLAALFDRLGDLTGLRGLTIRAGERTGDLLVVVDGDVPSQVDDWQASVCRVVRGRAEAMVGTPHLHEVVAGVRFRITGSAFFQNATQGAEALVGLVGEAVDERPGMLIDLYAGGGLFALTVAGNGRRVVAVESARQAVDDLAHNATAAGREVEIVHGRVEDVRLGADDRVTVIVDPPRSGLGADGVASLLAARPHRVVYVSCEPASLGRDVGLLAEHGFAPTRVTPVDLFPQTHHIETVAVLDR